LANKVKGLKKSNRFIDEEEVWKIAIRLIHGLKSLHSLNVFHRDLKTANVLISNDGAKLGDLNVSIVSKNGMAYTQTGTPYYASPEVWNSKAYDSKCDIWSLGCVIYELVTHKPPFHGNGMEDLWKKVNKGVYDSIPFCYSADLSSFIALCLKTKPS
jgi:NIMA (never in mitosis gene a)-related kinase